MRYPTLYYNIVIISNKNITHRTLTQGFVEHIYINNVMRISHRVYIPSSVNIMVKAQSLKHLDHVFRVERIIFFNIS